MTWNYTLPTAGAWADQVSQLRFLVRDTVQRPQSLSDEEVQLLIAEWQAAHQGVDLDVYEVASQLADAMADSYSSAAAVTKKVGDTSLTRSYSGESDRYRALARRLASKAQRPRMHGIGLASQPALPGQFGIGIMDNGATGGRLSDYRG